MNQLMILVLTFTVVNITLALRCKPCKETECVPKTNCPGGLVKDVCNCCDACAKQEGESCGGLWGTKGKCDKELRCLTTNSKFLFAIGICVRKCKEIAQCRIKCLHGFLPPKPGSCIQCECRKKPVDK